MAAEDGAKGLALIRQHKPDLVVSDVQMPFLDGFEVLDQVRSSDALAETAVILLTSLQDRSYMRQGMTTGADDYPDQAVCAARVARSRQRAIEQTRPGRDHAHAGCWQGRADRA